MAPEIYADMATFFAGVPATATGNGFKVTPAQGITTAWVADKAVTADSDNTALTASLLTAWADDSNVQNTITQNVKNGESFSLAINHDVAITWQTAAVAGLNQLERREQTSCASIALYYASTIPCVPAFGFRVPMNAAKDSIWYAAFKAEVTGATSNGLAVGVYYVSIKATVVEPYRNYPTWSALDTDRTDVISWQWTTTGMPSAPFPRGNGGWTY